MKFSPKEIYLRRILGLDRNNYFYFRQFYNLSLLLLDDERRPVAEVALGRWLDTMRTEQGRPSMDYILYQIEIMRIYHKKYLKIKTEETRKKISFQDLVIGLERVEEEIMSLVRAQSGEMRLSSPEAII